MVKKQRGRSVEDKRKVVGENEARDVDLSLNFSRIQFRHYWPGASIRLSTRTTTTNQVHSFGTMKLTPELLAQAPSQINAVKERQLDLRGE